MSDVFISYSRKDSDFTKRLHSALADQKRDVWVDWEDIPVTAEWWDEICKGIEAADTFVFITSPDSLSSPVCNMEIAHALLNHKRLIPIMRRATDEKQAFAALAARELDDNARARLNGVDILTLARDNWQALSRHNWLTFQDDAGFDTTFNKLITAIDTDLNYVQIHSRLLVRAREWEKRERESSFLLAGTELREAETFLADGVSKEPKPTTLHSEYILASQRAEASARVKEGRLQRSAKRRLQVLVGLLVVFSLFMGYSFYAFYTSIHVVIGQVLARDIQQRLPNIVDSIDGNALATLVRDVPAADDGYPTAPRYQQLANQLAQFKADDPDDTHYFIYIAGDQPNTIQYIATDQAADTSPAGQHYKEIEQFTPNSPMLTFFGGPFIEMTSAPLDEYERFMAQGGIPNFDQSSYTLTLDPIDEHNRITGRAIAPIYDSKANVVGVVGMSLYRDEYRWVLESTDNGFIALFGILIAAIVIGVLIYVGFSLRQRHLDRLAAEREAQTDTQ